MPNGVKYSTTTLTGALKRGNIALGVTGELGPTANTGFYSMPVPASGKYIINKVSPSSIPNFFAPQNDTELIQFARNEGATGANTGSAAAVLAWIATQPNLEAANFEYPNIITDGLVLNIDAGFVGSYPTTGTTIYDISGNVNNGTLYNGVGYSTNSGGVLTFDGVDDYIQIPNAASLQVTTGFTQVIWVKLNNIITDFYRNLFGKPNYVKYGMIVEWYGGNPILFDFTVSGNRNALGLVYPGIGWVMVAQSYNSTGGANNQIGYIRGGATDTIYATRTGNVDTDTSPMNIGQAGLSMNVGMALLYNRGLTQTELDQIYNATKTRFGF